MARPSHILFFLIWNIEIEESILQNPSAEGLNLSRAHSSKDVFQEKDKACVFYLEWTVLSVIFSFGMNSSSPHAINQLLDVRIH